MFGSDPNGTMSSSLDSTEDAQLPLVRELDLKEGECASVHLAHSLACLRKAAQANRYRLCPFNCYFIVFIFWATS
jgi:hypothetical protein